MRNYWLIPLFILILSACGDHSPAGNPELVEEQQMPAPSPQRRKYLLDSASAYYTNWINKGSFSGQFLISKNGYIIYSRAAGFSNAEAKEKNDLGNPNACGIY